MGLSHMWPILVYTGMCRTQCVFLAFCFVISEGLCCFGAGFDNTYTSDIIIGICCMFLCTIECDRKHNFISLIKTTWNT